MIPGKEYRVKGMDARCGMLDAAVSISTIRYLAFSIQYPVSTIFNYEPASGFALTTSQRILLWYC
jgi:hypothetical protein